MSNNQEKVVTIVSGGMDSAAVLYHAVEKYGNKNVTAVSFNYGSRHNKKEIPFARQSAKKLGVKHLTIDLRDAFSEFKSNLLKGQGSIPEGHYAAANMSQTVVPNRNMIMLSVAGGVAESIGAKKVLLGSHAGDHAIYPDCRIVFTKALSKALKLATTNEVEIESPFNHLSKSEVARIGLASGVDYKKTWSCYKALKRPCLKCGTCVERTESFVDNNIPDPLLTTDEWSDAVEYLNTAKKEFGNGS